jgi:sRNA-binding protein
MIDARPIIAMLCEKFPGCFVMYEQRRRPLALGIHREVAAAMPTLTKEQISAAMRSYVGNEFYCRACREGAPRINLMGHEAGVVTAAEAANSAARIAGIREWKKQKKAKAKAKAAAKIKVVPRGVNAAGGAGIPSRSQHPQEGKQMQKYVVVAGNLTEGFDAFGPFDSEREGDAFNEGRDAFTFILEQPKDNAKGNVVIAIGNLKEAWRFVGPFENVARADDYIDGFAIEDACVMTMKPVPAMAA